MIKTQKRASTRAIGARLRELRERRGWSQVELARKLLLSQSRLSNIERGAQSLTAEELLETLRLFNVPVTEFAAAQPAESQLQNALERLGARHLRESSEILPSERVAEVNDVVREVLISADPRQLTGLAPVLALHADEIDVRSLLAALAKLGFKSRLGWLVENTQAAIHREMEQPLPVYWRATYRRAQLELNGAYIFLATRVRASSSARRGARSSSPHRRREPAAGYDILDRDVRSEKTIRQLERRASDISLHWKVLTAITVDDFVEALRASRVADR